jgi:hypothetical protein
MPGAALIHETGKIGKTWRPRRGRKEVKRNGDSAWRSILLSRGHVCLLYVNRGHIVSTSVFSWNYGRKSRPRRERKDFKRNGDSAWRSILFNRGHVCLLYVSRGHIVSTSVFSWNYGRKSRPRRERKDFKRNILCDVLIHGGTWGDSKLSNRIKQEAIQALRFFFVIASEQACVAMIQLCVASERDLQTVSSNEGFGSYRGD